ncbi:putative GFO/IDH/MocA family oxidoreductase (plasmid) [Rhizobium freirei PRF 81]|uniref:Putative GFO/IDH/MocA family oxidoreductase n=1 Tax=Rhizobium freirei PRF 81 TaxID=363754 RepID=N6UQ27_9HYPH|nr:Gfo/Idh/MocA family oxidoreductase [Rhizobium freirei]ENN83850.1 putative GFO/IDH/MocA family oxidoreductase [Rhizobium freirei PRF 81]
MNKAKLRWGIVGPGEIAKTFAAALRKSDTGMLTAVGTRNPARASLAEDFAGARIVDGYENLLNSTDVDVVYIATPHVNHVEWAIKGLRAGKHVLVEKPVAMTQAGAKRVYEEAKKANRFAGEAFMYRPHPQTRKLMELVRDGAIGTPRIIRSNFGFNAGRILSGHRLFEPSLAGGAILDLGGYPASIVRLLAGAAESLPFLDPELVSGAAHIEGDVDLWSSATLKFSNGIIGELSCSMMAQLDNTLFVFGSAGTIAVRDFWYASGRNGGVGTITLTQADMVSNIEVRDERWLYTFEIDDVARSIHAGNLEFNAPGMSWEDSLGNMGVLDAWRRTAGLHYEIEQDELGNFQEH